MSLTGLLKKLFKKHYKKIQLIERTVEYIRDMRAFFKNYEKILIDAGLEHDVLALERKRGKLLEDIKNTFKIY